MRIAVVAPLVTPIREPQLGGSQAVVADLARGLAERGHEVEVYAAAGSVIPGVTVVDTGVRADQSTARRWLTAMSETRPSARSSTPSARFGTTSSIIMGSIHRPCDSPACWSCPSSTPCIYLRTPRWGLPLTRHRDRRIHQQLRPSRRRRRQAGDRLRASTPCCQTACR